MMRQVHEYSETFACEEWTTGQLLHSSQQAAAPPRTMIATGPGL
jgi:hypothetical protein